MDARQAVMVDRAGMVPQQASADPKERARRAAKAAGTGEAFRAWLEENWPIWFEFCKLADVMRDKGRSYYSARAVLHVLRWHRHLKDPTDQVFKINNCWSAPMARTYNRMHDKEFFRERDAG